LQTLQRQTIEPLTFVNMFLIIWNVIDYLAGRHYTGRSNTSTGVSRRLLSYNSRGRNPIRSDLQSSLIRNKDTLFHFCESFSVLKWLSGTFLYNFVFILFQNTLYSKLYYRIVILFKYLFHLTVCTYLVPSFILFICAFRIVHRFSLLMNKITSFLLRMI